METSVAFANREIQPTGASKTHLLWFILSVSWYRCYSTTSLVHGEHSTALLRSALPPFFAHFRVHPSTGLRSACRRERARTDKYLCSVQHALSKIGRYIRSPTSLMQGAELRGGFIPPAHAEQDVPCWDLGFRAPLLVAFHNFMTVVWLLLADLPRLST